MARHRLNAAREPYCETASLRAELADVKAQLRASRFSLGEERERAARLVTTIRSIFAHSLSSGATTDTIADHFSARLDVLARYQRASTEANDLEMLIRDELREFQFGEDPRIAISGPLTWVQPGQAHALGLALHELITNALKFGALSCREGRLEITWAVVAGELWLDWVETGLAVPQDTSHHEGFGRVLIEQELPEQIDARTSFELCPAGLRCQIAFALESNPVATRHTGVNILYSATILQ